MADSNCYYRRSAVLNVGGFNEKLQVMENVEVLWRLQKAGYKIDEGGKNVVFFHHRSVNQFSLAAILRRAFTYGYYWHKLHRIHPDKTGLSAFPLKAAAFISFVAISYFYPLTLWILLASLSFWFALKLYRDRVRVKSCIAHMKSRTKKIGALMLIIISKIMYEIFRELGKLYGMISP